nr:hypothetical protein [Tanacetum cinerariifolium]
MNLPDEEDEQVLMSEIHAEMCHETGSLDKNVDDNVPIYVHLRMSIYAGGDNEAVDNEDQHDEVQRAIDEQVLASQKKKKIRAKKIAPSLSLYFPSPYSLDTSAIIWYSIYTVKWYIADVAASFQRSQIHNIKLSMSKSLFGKIVSPKKSQVKLKC